MSTLLQVQIPVPSDQLPKDWDHPEKCFTYEYHWYRANSDLQGYSDDGSQKISGHWLPISTFNRLSGGRYDAGLRIRVYSNRDEAIADFRRASR